MKSCYAQYDMPKFQCAFCGCRYSSNAGLLAHSKEHFFEKPYQRTNCVKGSASLNDQENTLATQNHLCFTCGKYFDKRSRLVSHLEVHRKKRVCDDCGSLFSFKGFRNHKKINNALYISTKCMECGFDIKCLCAYIKHLPDHSLHIKIENFNNLFDIVEAIPIEFSHCMLCGRQPSDRISLLEHVENHLEPGTEVSTRQFFDIPLILGNQESFHQYEDVGSVSHSQVESSERKAIMPWSMESCEPDSSAKYDATSLITFPVGESEVKYEAGNTNEVTMNQYFGESFLEAMPHSIFSPDTRTRKQDGMLGTCARRKPSKKPSKWSSEIRKKNQKNGAESLVRRKAKKVSSGTKLSEHHTESLPSENPSVDGKSTLENGMQSEKTTYIDNDLELTLENATLTQSQKSHRSNVRQLNRKRRYKRKSKLSRKKKSRRVSKSVDSIHSEKNESIQNVPLEKENDTASDIETNQIDENHVSGDEENEANVISHCPSNIGVKKLPSINSSDSTAVCDQLLQKSPVVLLRKTPSINIINKVSRSQEEISGSVSSTTKAKKKKIVFRPICPKIIKRRCRDCGLFYKGKKYRHDFNCSAITSKSVNVLSNKSTVPPSVASSAPEIKKLELDTEVETKRRSVRKRGLVSYKEYDAFDRFLKTTREVLPDKARKKTGSVENAVKPRKTKRDMFDKNERPYCPLCGKIFLFKNTFESHKKLHEKAGWFVCYTCGNIYRSQSHLDRHCQSNHPLHALDADQERSVDISPEKEKNSHTPKSVSSDSGDRYCCVFCKKVFIGAAKFKKHKVLHNNQKLKCHFCDKGYSTLTNFNRHIRDFHDQAQNSSQQCSLCNKLFHSVEKFRKHLEEHKDAGWSICSVCGAVFTHITGLVCHTSRLHGKRQDAAPVPSDKSDKTTRSLQSHTKITSIEDQICACGICGATCKNYSGLAVHMGMNHKEVKRAYRKCLGKQRRARFVCTICGKKFGNKGALGNHTKMIHEKVESSCTLCGKTFASYFGVRLHMWHRHKNQRHLKVHSSSKMVSKDELKKKKSVSQMKRTPADMPVINQEEGPSKFRSRKMVSSDVEGGDVQMQGQIQTGTLDTKSYKCPACRRTYKTRDAFATHVRIHERSKWYICVDCGLCFWLKEGLEEHCLMYHPENWNPQEGNISKEGVRVSKTEKTSGNASALSHSEKMDCSVCGKRRLDIKYFTDHVLEHEKDNWFICEHCGNCYRDKNNLSLHKDKYHSEKGIAANALSSDTKVDVELSSGVKIKIERMLPCETCGEFYGTTKRDYQEHIASHEERAEKLYACSVCKESFNVESDLLSHNKIHMLHAEESPEKDTKKLSCSRCGMIFAIRKFYEAHLKRCDGTKVIPYKQNFSKLNGFMLHYQASRGKGMLEVQNSSVSLKRKSNLNKRKKMKCNLCERTFYFHVTLKYHMMMDHSQTRSPECEDAKKAEDIVEAKTNSEDSYKSTKVTEDNACLAEGCPEDSSSLLSLAFEGENAVNVTSDIHDETEDVAVMNFLSRENSVSSSSEDGNKTLVNVEVTEGHSQARSPECEDAKKAEGIVEAKTNSQDNYKSTKVSEDDACLAEGCPEDSGSLLSLAFEGENAVNVNSDIHGETENVDVKKHLSRENSVSGSSEDGNKTLVNVEVTEDHSQARSPGCEDAKKAEGIVEAKTNSEDSYTSTKVTEDDACLAERCPEDSSSLLSLAFEGENAVNVNSDIHDETKNVDVKKLLSRENCVSSNSEDVTKTPVNVEVTEDDLHLMKITPEGSSTLSSKASEGEEVLLNENSSFMTQEIF